MTEQETIAIRKALKHNDSPFASALPMYVVWAIAPLALIAAVLQVLGVIG